MLFFFFFFFPQRKTLQCIFWSLFFLLLIKGSGGRVKIIKFCLNRAKLESLSSQYMLFISHRCVLVNSSKHVKSCCLVLHYLSSLYLFLFFILSKHLRGPVLTEDYGPHFTHTKNLCLMGLSFFQNVCSTLVITQMMRYYEYILMITMDRWSWISSLCFVVSINYML